MPVTDLTDSLPWWTQQAGGGAPGGGVQPQGASWLQYLSQMFGISPAQAAQLSQNGSPNPHGDAPPDQPPFVGTLPAAPQQPLARYDPLSGGSANTGVAVRGPPPQPPYNPLAGGSANTGRPFGYGPPPQPTYSPLAGGSANTGAAPAPNPDAPTASAQPAAATPGPLANPGGAGGVGAASNPRFVPINRPNAPAGGSPYGRGGPPQMSALNLAGLFGGGPQGGPAAAPMGGGPVRGPLASGSGSISMADLYPAAAARRGMISMDDLYPARAAMRGMGRQPMSPTQLASAVRQPNWWPT